MIAPQRTNPIDWRAARFGRAARTYHESTPVQSAMAERLAGLLPDDFRPESILELGCGTGHLTRALALRWPKASILATDFSEAMLERAASSWDLSSPPRWRRLDARRPALGTQIFDLVASNALVQWFPDLADHFSVCRKLSSIGGVLAVAGFRDDHFPELDRILLHPPFGYPKGPGHPLATVAGAARRNGWEVESLEGEDWPVIYPGASAFLAHLRDSGANRPPPSGKSLGRSGLRQLLEGLEREAACPGGVRITWKPWFLLARAV